MICVALNILTNFTWTVVSFLIFMSFCTCVNIILAVGVNLYSIKYRGMATSIIMMFGRFGSFAGSTLVGLLLAQFCTSIFYLSAAVMIGKFVEGNYCRFCTNSNCAVVTYFLKYNKVYLLFCFCYFNFRLYFYLLYNKRFYREHRIQ